MPGTIKLMALLVACIGPGTAAEMAAAAESDGTRIPLLSDAECWKRLPPAERGMGQPLPSWARALAGSMPRSTAALLRVEYAHRVLSPLDPKLRARMRWVAAHANRCGYSEAYALADARRAGLGEAAMAGLARGNLEPETPAVRAALEFARKMTVRPAAVTDEEFAALVKHHGEKDVVAMVQLMAWANFLDRVVLSLGSPMEAGGPLPPLDVVFAPGELLTRQPSAPASATPPRSGASVQPGAGKDLVEDEPDWPAVSYDELQARLERQRGRTTRVRVPTWEEVERVIPPGSMWPNRVVWNLVCMGYQPELGGAWETYLRTSSVETGKELDRVFGASLFWVTTRAIDCPYCMGHCEMSLELAGLEKSEIAVRTRTLAGVDWSSFPAEEQRAYAFARKLTKAPWTTTSADVAGLLRDFGTRKGVMVIVAACRGHYMTRISNGFQLSLERDNVFRDWKAPAEGPTASTSGPAPVPLTRPEMKKLLEESKRDQPRLTPPAPTEEELAAARKAGSSFSGTRRVRTLLPPELRGGYYFLMDGRTLEYDMLALRSPDAPPPAAAAAAVEPSRRVDPDPNMTLDYAFKTMLFWVVSRANNCVYCMGHNETQLSAFGVSEDRIAALDSDWSQFTLAERAALELARKLTIAPQTITDDDIAAVRRHFSERQVLEMIGIVAGFNAMNRWTGPLRLTQEDFRVFLKPTSARYESSITRVGPAPAGSVGSRCLAATAPRPSLEPRSVVEAKWEECRERRPRFALVDESTARGLLPEGTFPTDRPLPNWVRLLAQFPKAGPAKVATLRTSWTKGNLPARLNAQLAWVSARADRSWYALAHARDRLRALGLADDAIFSIDQPGESTISPRERAAFAFARKLTVDPALIGDADFEELKLSYSDSEIAELIYHVNHDLFFNRLTEATQLPLEHHEDRPLSRR